MEELPPALAPYSDSCLCHELLLRGVLAYTWRRVLDAHCGPGVHMCPAAAIIAPELAAGRLEQLLRADLWKGLELDLLTWQPLPKACLLSDSDWGVL